MIYMKKLFSESEYEKIIELIILGSKEQYGRLNAMLTVHGLILAAFGALFAKGSHEIRTDIASTAMLLIGFLLCLPWKAFVESGSEMQNYFRCKAKEMEQRNEQSIGLFTNFLPKTKRFRKVSIEIITIFQFLYLVLISVVLWPYVYSNLSASIGSLFAALRAG